MTFKHALIQSTASVAVLAIAGHAHAALPPITPLLKNGISAGQPYRTNSRAWEDGQDFGEVNVVNSSGTSYELKVLQIRLQSFLPQDIEVSPSSSYTLFTRLGGVTKDHYVSVLQGQSSYAWLNLAAGGGAFPVLAPGESINLVLGARWGTMKGEVSLGFTSATNFAGSTFSGSSMTSPIMDGAAGPPLFFEFSLNGSPVPAPATALALAPLSSVAMRRRRR